MKKKLLFGMLAVIMCFTLTGCGKSEIEKFKEYLVEEAGYEEKNVDYFILKKDGYLYSISLGNGSFEKESLTNTDKFSIHKVYYDFEINKGRAEYLVDINRCEYDFVLEKNIPVNDYLYNCPDQKKFNEEMSSLKEIFDGYLKGAGIERLDLLKSESK